jgi:alkyl sulfatase BDS1-like metallo-beta-lactamase superfamily hydrolase
MRSALGFVDSVERVMRLEPDVLLLGHHGPLRGATRVRGELTRIRDAVQWVHDATVEAMNRGDDVWEAARDIALPPELEVGEAYGRVAWGVRAIWEGYAGWFHQRSTLELYPVAPEHGWSEMVALAGGPDAVAARAAQLLDDGDALAAVRLCEMAFAVDDAHEAALTTYVAAHERLLGADARANYWLTMWLAGEVRSARARLARSHP